MNAMASWTGELALWVDAGGFSVLQWLLLKMPRQSGLFDISKSSASPDQQSRCKANQTDKQVDPEWRRETMWVVRSGNKSSYRSGKRARARAATKKEQSKNKRTVQYTMAQCKMCNKQSEKIQGKRPKEKRPERRGGRVQQRKKTDERRGKGWCVKWWPRSVGKLYCTLCVWTLSRLRFIADKWSSIIWNFVTVSLKGTNPIQETRYNYV